MESTGLDLVWKNEPLFNSETFLVIVARGSLSCAAIKVLHNIHVMPLSHRPAIPYQVSVAQFVFHHSKRTDTHIKKEVNSSNCRKTTIRYTRRLSVSEVTTLWRFTNMLIIIFFKFSLCGVAQTVDHRLSF